MIQPLHLIDHVGFPVRDAAKSKNFYEKALRPLDIELVSEYEGWYGLGKGEKSELWFGEGEVKAPIHIAFTADTRMQVDTFYEAALTAGGKDNGAPGLRPYHEHYYGAFVLDPDGNNVEVVCHKPE